MRVNLTPLFWPFPGFFLFSREPFFLRISALYLLLIHRNFSCNSVVLVLTDGNAIPTKIEVNRLSHVQDIIFLFSWIIYLFVVNFFSFECHCNAEQQYERAPHAYFRFRPRNQRNSFTEMAKDNFCILEGTWNSRAFILNYTKAGRIPSCLKGARVSLRVSVSMAENKQLFTHPWIKYSLTKPNITIDNFLFLSCPGDGEYLACSKPQLCEQPL